MSSVEIPAGYVAIGGGYSYGALRVGMTVRHPSGAEIYIQPGDDRVTMMDNIDALDAVSEDIDDPARGRIADMVLGDYFQD